MQPDTYYMKLAVKVARKSLRDGGATIGAVLVDDTTGRVVATGESVVAVTHDPTAHAEINAIREATRIRQSDKLHNTTLFSTLEPCHMCLSAAAWARIPRVVFGAYKQDVHHDSYFDIVGKFSDEEEAKRMNIHSGGEHMQVEGGVRREECVKLLYPGK